MSASVRKTNGALLRFDCFPTLLVKVTDPRSTDKCRCHVSKELARFIGAVRCGAAWAFCGVFLDTMAVNVCTIFVKNHLAVAVLVCSSYQTSSTYCSINQTLKKQSCWENSIFHLNSTMKIVETIAITKFVKRRKTFGTWLITISFWISSFHFLCLRWGKS